VVKSILRKVVYRFDKQIQPSAKLTSNFVVWADREAGVQHALLHTAEDAFLFFWNVYDQIFFEIYTQGLSGEA